MTTKPFFETIHRLRSGEELLLHSRVLTIDADDAADVANLLQSEWDNETLGYPGTPPPIHAAAALWAAKIVYTAAQLLLYRKQPPEDLPAWLPPSGIAISAGSMLSADLCLRTLPAILHQLKAIDPDDALIPLLEAHLQQWHYAAVGYPLPPEALDFSPILSHPTALQLYTDRVIERKDKALADHPALASSIAASLGGHADLFWSR